MIGGHLVVLTHKGGGCLLGAKWVVGTYNGMGACLKLSNVFIMNLSKFPRPLKLHDIV